MLKGKTFLGVLFAAAICSPLFSSPAQAALDADLRCRLGAYSLSDGRSLIVIGYNGTPRDLEYVLSSGEYGHLVATSTDNYTLKTSAGHDYGLVSFTECALGKVTFNESGRPGVTGTRMSMNVAETFFDSGGTRLHGKLVLPANDKADAIVVWIQGSDDDPETDDIFWQYLLPLHGIGVFTYDKRGSGQSQGELTADFYLRAADTAAAVKEARELAPGVTRFGDFGGSQGGWIAPLTATKTELDFVIVGYGLAEGVTAQDRDEVEEMVRDAGYGDEVMPKVHEITAATTRIVKSEWKSGWHQFVAVERKYTNEPWMKAISGENGYTAKMLAMPIDKVSEL